MDEQIKALWEVIKDFGRWALVFFIGWLLDNGYAFFSKSKLSPEVIIIISVVFKYADYYWHKYNKSIQKVPEGESSGIIPF